MADHAQRQDDNRPRADAGDWPAASGEAGPPDATPPHSDLATVGDIGLTGEGAGAGEPVSGAAGAAELGEAAQPPPSPTREPTRGSVPRMARRRLSPQPMTQDP